MMEIMKRTERLKIEEKLKELDVNIKISYFFIRQAKERIRIFTGNLDAQDLIRLGKILTIDSIGLYFAFSKEQDFRLGFDASILYGKASKKIIELDENEAKEWLNGKDIDKKTGKQGFFLVKHKRDILGCGKATPEKLLNFVPKERRVQCGF